MLRNWQQKWDRDLTAVKEDPKMTTFEGANAQANLIDHGN
jgi:hypothetical protein